MSNYIHMTLSELTKELVGGRQLCDPFLGITAVRPNRTCIAWNSQCLAELVEESPLVEAIFTAAEDVQFTTGHGGIFTHSSGQEDAILWQAGDGAQLFAQPAAHIYI